MPLIPAFVERFPEVELDLRFTDRALDLIDEGIDVAIRSGELPDSRLVSRPLQTFRLLLCAAPAYLARHGTPRTLRDLAEHAAVRFRHPATGKLLAWPLLGPADEGLREPRTVLACNNIEAVFDAAARGLGIACLPDFLAHRALADGRLAGVLEQQLGAHGRFQALWPTGRHLSPKVRVFVDHLASQLGEEAVNRRAAEAAPASPPPPRARHRARRSAN
jgi:DNA-binding transcriptional LysR family regulator